MKLAESIKETVNLSSVSESGDLRKDLKYRFKKDKDGKFDLQFQSKMTGSWIHVRSFADKAEGQKYLKDNMEK